MRPQIEIAAVRLPQPAFMQSPLSLQFLPIPAKPFQNHLYLLPGDGIIKIIDNGAGS